MKLSPIMDMFLFINKVSNMTYNYSMIHQVVKSDTTKNPVRDLKLIIRKWCFSVLDNNNGVFNQHRNFLVLSCHKTTISMSLWQVGITINWWTKKLYLPTRAILFMKTVVYFIYKWDIQPFSKLHSNWYDLL
jgi:hypothetical protein